jgi:polyadenylate-binding protein
MAAPNSSSSTPYASASLYVGDLSPDVSEALLFEIFNAVGPVASVRVCRDSVTRRSLGYAYINFHRVEDAERALDTMNFKNIRGRPCRIMWSHRDPSLRKSGLGNIFVKNLAKTIDNKTLYDTFSMFGNILSCKVAQSFRGESLGYGFVHYESDESARNAIARVDGKVIAGQTVSVSAFKSKKDRGLGKATYTNLYVKNLPDNSTQESLTKLFSEYGQVTSVMLSHDRDEKFRGVAFVNFEKAEDASAAVEALNDTQLGDKKLFVTRHQKRDERERELRQKFEQKKAERQKHYTGMNLYIKNLGDDVDDTRLLQEFQKYGEISSAKIMTDSAGKSRGFGFVNFVNPEDATKVVTELNGRMLSNKPLYIAVAQRKDVRRAQLESSFARSKMGGMPSQIMGTPQVYYQGMPQRVMYPQQLVPRGRWPQNQTQMVPAVRGVNYMVPATNGGSGRGGGRGSPAQRGRGRGAPRPDQAGRGRGGIKYNQNVRNPQPQSVLPLSIEPLTIKALAAAPEDQKKQIIGESLFPLVREQQPELAGKITGMLLEMDNGELLHLLENREALNEKVLEALQVLQQQPEDEEDSLEK